MEPGTITYAQSAGIQTSTIGLVVKIDVEKMTVEFSETGKFSRGKPVKLYCKSDIAFLNVTAHVLEISKLPSHETVEFQIIQTEEMEDIRASFRVSVAGAVINATIGEEQNCPIIDISSNGVGVFTSKKHSINDAIPMSVEFANEEFAGIARVCNITAERKHGFRCGLEVLRSESRLISGLNKISSSVQREQLRRIAERRT